MHPGWGPDERRLVGRTHTVTVSSVLAGWVELNGGHRDWRPRIVLPVARWAGAGTYWKCTQVTPELLAVDGLVPLTLPDLDPHDVRLLGAALTPHLHEPAVRSPGPSRHTTQAGAAPRHLTTPTWSTWSSTRPSTGRPCTRRTSAFTSPRRPRRSSTSLILRRPAGNPCRSELGGRPPCRNRRVHIVARPDDDERVLEGRDPT